MATPLLHKKLIDDLFPSEMAILSFDLNLGFDIAQLALLSPLYDTRIAASACVCKRTYVITMLNATL